MLVPTYTPPSQRLEASIYRNKPTRSRTDVARLGEPSRFSQKHKRLRHELAASLPRIPFPERLRAGEYIPEHPLVSRAFAHDPLLTDWPADLRGSPQTARGLDIILWPLLPPASTRVGGQTQAIEKNSPDLRITRRLHAAPRHSPSAWRSAREPSELPPPPPRIELSHNLAPIGPPPVYHLGFPQTDTGEYGVRGHETGEGESLETLVHSRPGSTRRRQQYLQNRSWRVGRSPIYNSPPPCSHFRMRYAT